MIGLVAGGYLVTENAVTIAERFGLSQKLIGLTILAVGTSLPELATCLVAAYKKNTDIAVGNIIGSNIFNIFFILAINGLVRPIEFASVLNIDLMVLTGGTILLMVTMFTLNTNKLDRWEAIVLLICYFVYTWYLIVRN
jgi:cation:H+ antiporter